jgi:hypothetical protein
MRRRFLILIFGCLPIFLMGKFSFACEIKSPYSDASKRISEKNKRNFIVQKEKLNADKYDDLIFIDKDSCSSSGCTNIIYTSFGSKGCYNFSGNFYGFITVKKSGPTKGSKVLNLRQGLVPRVLRYSLKKNSYEIVP